jgi:hypothetical protein
MHKPSRPKKRLLRTTLECLGAVAFVLAGTAVSNADPTVTGQVEHFVSCFGLMITDPAAHESECGPGIPPVYDPISGSSGGPAPRTTLTITTTAS